MSTINNTNYNPMDEFIPSTSNNDINQDNNMNNTTELLDDGYPTLTSTSQEDTMLLISQAWEESTFHPQTFREKTIQYLQRAFMEPLDANFISLDASRPWLTYWTLHALILLGVDPMQDNKPLLQRYMGTISSFQHFKGGFGGGPQQMPHLAPTFASTMTLCSVGSVEALRVIHRPALYSWLLSLKLPNGGFAVHHDGECDARAMYCALAVASITNMLTPQLKSGCVEWLRRAQGFDGGVGGEHGTEAHGGYAYCCLASLVILGETRNVLDLDAFVRWLTFRQMSFEGGFQGRTQKLVDSCYSFWVGACFELLRFVRWEGAKVCGGSLDVLTPFPSPNYESLERYVLEACAHEKGGVQDKPGTGRDFYHTCYALSGLSVTQDSARMVPTLRLQRTDPIYNVEVTRIARAKAFFAKLPNTHDELI
jgi:protein farnesyltransferase subunit beta